MKETLPPDALPGLQAMLPKGWSYTIASKSGRMGHPHGLEEPLFRADFVSTSGTFLRVLPGGKSATVQPSLRLHFHRREERPRIFDVIEREKVFSWEIPILFGETKDYVIVTSPEWVNHGVSTTEARTLYEPLEKALREYIRSRS